MFSTSREQYGSFIKHMYLIHTPLFFTRMLHVFIPMSHEYDVKIKTHAMVASSGDTIGRHTNFKINK